ncbi:tRNA (5-methylaminomethyl-2-thiouridylate)-methyltransferase [Terasakiispira papahanaumokuakeensis]|uniref:tRNA (5-methylaminomethyl-2-thiouridylate)-methyltransferase n=1 Tax=Terasakiispira papahanaumokuakeensis TaxID=197479 RepID=A0A1E2VB94_9GAMM|nr:tRNA (5-methylaminomethyl-2-thiouridylate)-methyltransferase [Terasakiispira papahanaumokuakeensis]ODC04288.1 tRNA (5-methylaminomethyl-2-thiouridylate)-methyltransferase [Terasakiispira papahanaumokuakeensis]
MTQERKAVALVSGGLDSMLAVRTLQNQGIHVEGINFYTGFCVEGHTQAIRKQDREKQKRNNALWVAEQLGIKLHIIDISEEYKDIVLNPKYGYGQHLNPCLDCKIDMVSRAWQWAQDHGFDFVVTGEVMGQRPKSQRKETLPLIARQSEVEDRLLRPLCAKHMPETLPEREGWVDREKLHDFHGRNRKPQFALAREFGFSEWAQPAGGCCFLTDETFAKKMQDLWQSRGERDYELDDIMLLKIGRHIRPKPHFKLIIAREEGENRYLEGYRRQFAHVRPESHGGPFALIDGRVDTQDDLELALSVIARFTQGKSAPEVTLSYCPEHGQPAQMHTVVPMAADALPQAWYR